MSPCTATAVRKPPLQPCTQSLLVCLLPCRLRTRLAYTARMATLNVLAFDPDGRPVEFSTQLDDLQLFLMTDAKDGVSLFDYVSGTAVAPAATKPALDRSQWQTHDAAARLSIRNHLLITECAHFSQHKTAKALYDAVVARYSSPATAALGRLMLPYLFPDLSSFTTAEDLISHLRASDTRLCAALPAEFLTENRPPMYFTLYFLITRLLDTLHSVRDHFLALDPHSLTVDDLEKHLLIVEKNILAPGGAEPGGAEPGGAEPRGAEPKGAELGGAETGGAEPGREESGGAEPGGTESGGVAPGGAEASARGPAAGGAGAGVYATGVVSAGGSGAAAGAGAGGSGAAEAASAGGSGAAAGAGAGGSGAAASAGTEGSESANARSPWSRRLRPRVPLTSQQLHDWYGRRQGRASGARGSTAGGTSADVTGAGSGAEPGGAPAGDPGSGGTASGDTETGDPGTGGAGSGGAAAGGAGPRRASAEGFGAAGGAGAVGDAGAAGAGGAAQPRLFFAPPSPSSQPPSDSVPHQVLSLPSFSGLPLQPGSPLPAPSPYTEQIGGLTERREPASRPVSPVRSGRPSRRVPHSRQPAVTGTHLVVRRPSSPPQCVPLPSPPASSLPTIPERESDCTRAAHSTVTRLQATVVTDPSFESAAASALVAELVDFAAACRLNYAASFVAESDSVCPPSVGGEFALGTDVLDDRQEDLECLAAAAPHLVSMLLVPKGDPDGPDISTLCSYAEAIAGSLPVFKARYVARGFSQREGVDFFQTFSPTPKMTTLQVLLHVAAQRDYELHSLNFSIAFLHGSLHEEIWLRRPPGFTGSFPPGTQWSLQRPVYGLRQASREWHDTLRTTLAALGFAPSTADPSLFLRTDTSLPPFYILVDTEALALMMSELQKRHTCTDLGELRSYLGLQITRDRARRTITLTQSHMVQQVLQRFGFTWSSPQHIPLATGHSLSAPPSDEFVEPSGSYPELVGCLMVLRYLCGTSSMGLVLGGRSAVVLTGHSDTSWVDDQATQQSSQGYTFSLGSGSVSWCSTRSSSVLSSSCEAEIYATAMAAHELRWLTYLLTNLGERPCSPPVLYVDNKATIALCLEHRLEHRTKHIALRYFLAQELQQRGQVCLAHVATRANNADIFTKTLPSGDHQRLCT
ncbi:unnamed protein product [Closterium sp. NIES-53]